ncbi:hypothetical protein Shpa_29 [Paracoccus phage Shpa]|uniref:Uncharacterized protein n=1 Tax=Paracoccus phage Shpa TaxID=1647282 RepID=A0A0U2BUC9_9CAUD|nr:hypothetical protein FDG85_gp29 [Paracoccus phage Shpa]AKG94540.1 hypothetical protein Shpa_29 [Paracoccus phage Shpa]
MTDPRDTEMTGTISTARHQVVRYRAGHESGDLFEEGQDFDGLTLTIEVADAADARAMLNAISWRPLTKDQRMEAAPCAATRRPPMADAPLYRISRSTPPHRADGLTAHVNLGDGATARIVNPQSFADGGPEWRMRYGQVEPIRYVIASLIGSYDDLLSGDITMKEATRRLSLMRQARAALAKQDGGE